MLFPGNPAAAEPAQAHALIYPVENISINTANGPVELALEIARTLEQEEQGLMYRWHMPERAGMIFLFHHAEAIDFWMKDTHIPLDIIFIDQLGRVFNIVRYARPESTLRIPSQGEALAVIELNGGAAERLHIAKWDKVLYPWFHE